jgi:hypothetical protein
MKFSNLVKCLFGYKKYFNLETNQFIFICFFKKMKKSKIKFKLHDKKNLRVHSMQFGQTPLKCGMQFGHSKLYLFFLACIRMHHSNPKLTQNVQFYL